MYMCIYIFIYTYIYIYIYAHIYMRVYMYIYILVFSNVYIYTYIYADKLQALSFSVQNRVLHMYIFPWVTQSPQQRCLVSIFIYICIYLYIHTYICTYIYMYIYVYSCVSHRYASDDAFFKMLLAESFEVAAVPEDYLPDKLPAVSIFALKRLFP